MTARVEVIGLEGVGEITAGDDLGLVFAEAVETMGERLDGDDILVVSHKVVSKAERRVRRLGEVEPSERATQLARRVDKDPGMVELILGETRTVLRAEPGRLIVETNSGWVCANAGIDASNVPGDDSVVLLPEDADASARRIRAGLRSAAAGLGGSEGSELGRGAPAVVIADSFGRAWRLGQTDVAIGCAGLMALDDWRGRADAQGRPLWSTVVAVADEVAAAADLVRAKDAGVPAAIVRGLGRHITEEDGLGAAPLRRAEADDLFR